MASNSVIEGENAFYDVAGNIWQALPPGPVRPPPATTSPAPRRRAIEIKHSHRDRSTTYLQGGCACRRADSARRFNVGSMLFLADFLPGTPPCARAWQKLSKRPSTTHCLPSFLEYNSTGLKFWTQFLPGPTSRGTPGLPSFPPL